MKWKSVLMVLSFAGLFGGGTIIYREMNAIPTLQCMISADMASADDLPEYGGRVFNELKKHKNNRGNANDMLNAAQLRKAAMLKAMRKMPEMAMAYVIPKSPDRDEIETIAEQCVEQETTVEGDLFLVHMDMTDGTSVDEAYVETADGQKIRLNLSKGKPDRDKAGKKVKVRGWKLDNDILVDSDNPTSIEISRIESAPSALPNVMAAVPNSANLGPNKAAFLLVNFTDAKDTTLTVPTAQNLAGTTLKNFFTEVSYGKTDFQPTVFGQSGPASGSWFEITLPSNSFTISNWDPFIQASVAAADSVVNYGDYRHLVIYAPWAFNGLGGLQLTNVAIKTNDPGSTNGTMRKNVVLVQDERKTPSTFDGQTMRHEIGHSFGSPHDSLQVCPQGGNALVSGSAAECQMWAYGNPYSAMGNNFNSGHYSAISKANSIGWLTEPNLLIVTQSGQHRIEPFETAGGLKALVFPRSRPPINDTLFGDRLYVEYRRPIGFDSDLRSVYGPLPDAYGGVLLTHKGNQTFGFTAGDGTLIDASPSLGDPAFNSNPSDLIYKNSIALLPGKTFTDEATGAKITVMSADSVGATVNVVPGTVDMNWPVVKLTKPIASTASNEVCYGNFPTMTVSGVIRFEAEASDDLKLADVRIMAGGYVIPNGTNKTAPFAVDWDSRHRPNGWVDFKAQAYDAVAMASNSCYISLQIDNPPDLVPPAITLTRPTNGSNLVGSQIYVEGIGTDNLGLSKIELFRDADTTPIYTAQMSQWIGVGDYPIDGNIKTAMTVASAGLGPGVHQLRLKAYDFTGNVAETAPITYTQGASVTTFGIAPDVAITGPASPARGTVNVSASASDFRTPPVTISVAFKVDGNGICVDSTAPYSCAWNTAATTNGSHTITAVATDQYGNSAQASRVVTVGNDTTPPPPATDTTAPSVPNGILTSVPSSSQINMSWQPSTDNVGVAGYRVFRNGTQVGISTANSFAHVGLMPSTTYSLAVSAFDAAGNVSAQSSTVSATTLAVTTPPSFNITSHSVVGKSASSATITWSTDTPATGVVRYGRNQNALDMSAADGLTGMSHTVQLQNLSRNTRYYYQIQARSADGTKTTQTGILNFRTSNK